MTPWTGIRRNWCRLAAIFSLLVILLASGGEVLGAEKRGGVLRVGLTGDLTTLDPHMSTSAIDRHLYCAIYNTLVGLDPELRIVPELATAWETPDPLTYVFTLQRGVKFHDGTDFDASIVKWNFEHVKDPAVGRLRQSEVALRACLAERIERQSAEVHPASSAGDGSGAVPAQFDRVFSHSADPGGPGADHVGRRERSARPAGAATGAGARSPDRRAIPALALAPAARRLRPLSAQPSACPGGD